MSEIVDLSPGELLIGLRAGDFSSREITSVYLERIEQLDPGLHAYLHVNREISLRQADEADRKLQEWRRGQDQDFPALTGLPLAVKDVLCVKEMPCTSGSMILEGYIPPFDATAVGRLKQAGVVILGKTNTDEFAMGSSTENSAYGVTFNPWDLERVPGGSSGGSASAVSARLAPVALGTDTGGSVRQPDSFCGVTGIKPTYGRVSRYGLVAYGSSLDVVGVLGCSAADILPIFEQMAGEDALDATTVDLPVPEINLRAGLPTWMVYGSGYRMSISSRGYKLRFAKGSWKPLSSSLNSAQKWKRSAFRIPNKPCRFTTWSPRLRLQRTWRDLTASVMGLA